MTAGGAPLLESDALTKRFGGVTAVEECSFAVPTGSITALIGPNGSGKTTLFNLLTGYDSADSGAVRFGGRAVRRPDPIALYRSGLTRTFQQARIFPQLTLIENMTIAVHQPWRAIVYPAVRRADRARAHELLDEFGLARLEGERAGRLSYGQKKLLEFATVLMSRPRLVLLDEPTAGVNPVMVEQDRGADPRPARPRPHLPRRRAQHAARHGPLRPGHRARPWAQDRRRPARTGAERPRRPRRLPRHMSFLRIHDVCAGYGQADILHGVSLELEAGTVTCVIGPNGAGKSTVLRVLSGLLKPRVGTVELAGDPVGGLSPAALLRKGIVHVPQERSLFPLMTIWDNLLMGGHSLRDRALVRRRAEEIVERFPLIEERRHERAGTLSGGQQKLIEIARSLMLEPRLILLDEPTMGLDAKARHAVFETVQSLNEGGRTILLVEQNARLGLSVSHVGAVMDMGVVRLVDEASKLVDDPRVAALYLGGNPDTRANGGAARAQG